MREGNRVNVAMGKLKYHYKSVKFNEKIKQMFAFCMYVLLSYFTYDNR